MKKQLLTLAMLVGLCVAGNAFAAGKEEEVNNNENITNVQPDSQGENGGTKVNNEDLKWYNLMKHFGKARENWKPLTIGAAFGAAVALVADNFDKIVAKSADVEEEDEEEENEDEE